nr:cytochrome c biogenesis FN [Agathis dammara]
MSINELCHYLLFLGLSVAFTYDRKQPPALGASPHFSCTLLSLPGPSFRHTPSNFPNHNVFTNSNASAPLPYQISGTRSNHEGSIPPRCRIPSFYGFPFRYRVQPHNVSERGRETAFCSFASSFVKNVIRSLPENPKGGAKEPPDFEQALCAVPRTLVPSRTRRPGRAFFNSSIFRERGELSSPVISSSSSPDRTRPFMIVQRRSTSLIRSLMHGEKSLKRSTLKTLLRRQEAEIRRSRGILLAFKHSTLLILSRRPGFPGKQNSNRPYALLDPEPFRIMRCTQGPFSALRDPKRSFASGGARRSGSRALFARSGKTNLLLHFARDVKERAEQRIHGALSILKGIALFFPLFPLASSNPFIRNSFVCTESLAELNPVLQDPILAIHPPRIYAGDVASAMGFGLCISKMMNGICALYLPMRTERNRTLCSAGCVGALTSEILTLSLSVERINALSLSIIANRVGGKKSCFALSLHSNRSLLLRRRRYNNKGALSPLWTGVLMGEQAKRVVRGKDTTTTSPLCRTAGANTVVSDPKKDRERIRIWILTCWWFFTVGILLGSWWAHHELGRGGRWFRDPVENASSMPWVLATARIHPVILPKVHFWTLFPNTVTFLCCVPGTFLVRSGLPAPVHSSATDSTRGIFLWRFFLLITGISLILLFQISGHRSIETLKFSKPLVRPLPPLPGYLKRVSRKGKIRTFISGRAFG